MRLKIVLRLTWALIFAVVTVILSELIPPLNGVNPFIIKVLLTIASAGVGFLIFPEIASNITAITISLFNSVINRLSSEIMNQLLRLPRTHMPVANPISQVGGVSITRPLILDTSAIIDGRILDIAKTGFIYGNVLIPNSVLIELQQVADSADNIKRSRGRKGFETIDALKKITSLRIEVWDQEPVAKTVDERIIKLAKNLHGKIVTTDFNLNRVATVSNVTVLNVNDLANAVKTVAVPGEEIELKIIHVGKDPKQGVGYLNDGTMIVVEDGGQLLGKTVRVQVTRNLQGSAGKMIFAKKA